MHTRVLESEQHSPAAARSDARSRRNYHNPCSLHSYRAKVGSAGRRLLLIARWNVAGWRHPVGSGAPVARRRRAHGVRAVPGEGGGASPRSVRCSAELRPSRRAGPRCQAASDRTRLWRRLSAPAPHLPTGQHLPTVLTEATQHRQKPLRD